MPPRRAATKLASVKQEPEANESPLPCPPPDGTASTASSNLAEIDEEDETTISGSQAELSNELKEEQSDGIDNQVKTKESPERRRQRVPGGYNALKTFDGQTYSGMAIGGAHKWNYEPGQWTETKTEPDLWKIDFHTNKRRQRNAPKNSGAPVDTEYHWLIVAHQHVKKLDANTYETHMEGSKYKLAHKSVKSAAWSIPTVKKQREREIELLEDAKRRVQGLPPVMASEKVKTGPGMEKGQQKVDALFGEKKRKQTTPAGNTEQTKKVKTENENTASNQED